MQGQTYHLLVHGFGDASGNFSLRITTTRLATLIYQAIEQEPSSPQYEAFEWTIYNTNSDLEATLSDDQLVERFVLAIFYFATNGDSWEYHTGFLRSFTHCNWNYFGSSGVVCNDEGSVVTLVFGEFLHSSTFEFRNCTNTLSLTLLSNVDLGHHGISGSLPTEIGLLSNLSQLSLGNNALTGTLPSELGTISTLQSLNLQNNALTGTIPTELGTMSSLEFLVLSDNMLRGPIPSELGQILTLQQLRLKNNALTGTLPTELGFVTNVSI
jgi:Leucine-rich repeat (LRR) protein